MSFYNKLINSKLNYNNHDLSKLIQNKTADNKNYQKEKNLINTLILAIIVVSIIIVVEIKAKLMDIILRYLISIINKIHISLITVKISNSLVLVLKAFRLKIIVIKHQAQVK